MANPCVIIGANLTGLCTALALSHLKQASILVERKVNIVPKTPNDGRAIALSYGSKQILESIGLWSKIEKFAGEINQIRVTDQLSPFFLHFNNDSTLGYLVESDDLQKIFYDFAVSDPNITILTDTTYNLLENNFDKVSLELITNSDSLNAFATKNEQESAHLLKQKKLDTPPSKFVSSAMVSPPLLIAADGKSSHLRKLCNIKHYQHSYDQTAIVCKVWHEFSHEQIAQEMFLPNGPFAILPLKDPHYSGIVWTENNQTSGILLEMDKEKFSYFLSQKFTDYLGEVKLTSNIVSYPLELVLAEKYYHNRVMLIGDSAHSIHPIAGQGFNLALRDIAAMIELYRKYQKIGLEFGCYQSMQEYQKLRNSDNLSMAIITDALNKLFSNNIAPIGFIRKLGLHAVNYTPSLKNFFMQYAMAKRNDEK